MSASPLPEAAVAEKAVVGAAMQSGSLADSVLEVLTPEMLTLPAHQHILRIIAELREAAKPVDLIILTTEAEKRGLLGEVGDTGYLTAGQMAGAFQLLRSNDLIWSRMGYAEVLSVQCRKDVVRRHRRPVVVLHRALAYSLSSGRLT